MVVKKQTNLGGEENFGSFYKEKDIYLCKVTKRHIIYDIKENKVSFYMYNKRIKNVEGERAGKEENDLLKN